MAWLSRFGTSATTTLGSVTPNPEMSPLICTDVTFVGVAEQWKGPVVYWPSERSVHDRRSANEELRLCELATLVCPVSDLMAAYLVEHAECDPGKIATISSAASKTELLSSPLSAPADLPASLEHIQRPIAGIIGELAEEIDWIFLQQLVETTPFLSWVFVGPAIGKIASPKQRKARDVVRAHPKTVFLGALPHDEIARYAQSFDVGLLPYLRSDSLYMGSSDSFYTLLASTRPILATRGVEELIRKRPLIELVNDVEEARAVLERLRATNFDDGLGRLRWTSSQQNTWHDRAHTMRDALLHRLSALAQSQDEMKRWSKNHPDGEGSTSAA
jgi:hypothetical protein